jgi:TetR/AcrR family transcriptional regulator, biofilm operon repressor
VLENIGLTGATNREKILFVSIDLFAQKGYDKVTLREIATMVGIKAASIYNHFQSKEDILEQIANYFSEQLQSGVYPYFEAGDDADVGKFIRSIADSTNAFFADPLHAKIGAILLREQFHHDLIRKMLLKELIVRPRQVIASYFARLIEAGKMKGVDPMIAAKEYHAFYIYEFYENSLALGSTQRGEQELQEERDEHVRLFLETFCIGPESPDSLRSMNLSLQRA